MKTRAKQQISDVNYIGIVDANEWYEKDTMAFIDGFIVGKWSDFHDGIKSNIEGKETLALCKSLEHAQTIFNMEVEKIPNKRTDSL